ncbi:hypothetical protein Q1695_013864 [Nippostrongylus brasiliensis]|nr:hypothetical protein Q1695_013864 [Nippostrongylus brasiliensis]
MRHVPDQTGSRRYSDATDGGRERLLLLFIVGWGDGDGDGGGGGRVGAKDFHRPAAISLPSQPRRRLVQPPIDYLYLSTATRCGSGSRHVINTANDCISHGGRQPMMFD